MGIKGISIAGCKNDDGIDYYQTPEWAIKALMKREIFLGEVLEPCSGAGAISKVLEAWGFYVKSSDIREDESVYGDKGVSVFDYTSADNIITNPPYRIAQEVIEHCLKVTSDKVAMLLKLQFLESLKRYDFFNNMPLLIFPLFPLKKVYVFCRRVSMYPEGKKKPVNSGTIAYAWYVWQKGYERQPVIEWIKD